MEWLNNFFDQLPVWVPLFTAIVTTFAAVAAVTPNKVDNKIAAFLVKAINLLGLNVGQAKNKDS